MAARLARTGATVDRIRSSTALRARTTATVFGAALGADIELDPELYLAAPSILLANAHATNAASVMLVAHDPGLSDLAARLSGGGIDRLPTCAVARFVWNTHAWIDAQPRPADWWSLDTPRGH